MASDYFLNRLKQDPNDVRWGVMSNDESSTTRLGSSYKYSGSTTLEGDDKSKNSSSAVNIKVIRLSEIYLIAAEAAFPTNKDLAATYLNEIRKRSPGSGTGYSSHHYHGYDPGRKKQRVVYRRSSLL